MGTQDLALIKDGPKELAVKAVQQKQIQIEVEKKKTIKARFIDTFISFCGNEFNFERRDLEKMNDETLKGLQARIEEIAKQWVAPQVIAHLVFYCIPVIGWLSFLFFGLDNEHTIFSEGNSFRYLYYKHKLLKWDMVCAVTSKKLKSFDYRDCKYTDD